MSAAAWTRRYEHFGVLGTSLGSCYAFLASTHDPRIRVNAFNHASTAFGDVTWAGHRPATSANSSKMLA